MKSMINNDENMNNLSSDSNNKWLCFSLSHNMKMESHDHQQQVQQLSSSDYGLVFGSVEPYSSLSTMPLKSDGSLCLMEALARSQSHQAMVMTSGSSSTTPKLEDFFGSTATMLTRHHHHHNQEEAAMALSLDNVFFQTPPSYSQFHVVGETMAMEQVKDGEVGGFDLVGSMGYGDHLRSLSLSMSPGSQSSCVTASHQISPSLAECGVVLETKKRGPESVDENNNMNNDNNNNHNKKVIHRKSLDTFGHRTSQYRGVTRHRWTGRYEAHLWDNSCKKEGQSRKGRQVYLGGYDMEDKAARAYDLAALKYWGPTTHINFPLENYEKELEEMKNRTRQEYVAHLRRKSSGFSRGASMYRGVTRHHQHGRWQARIGRVAGNKDLYLGTFSAQEEAAEAYDVAAIKFRGLNAVTNFDISRYDVDQIMTSNALLSREFAKKPSITESPNLIVSTNENYIASQQQQQDLELDGHHNNKALNSFEPFSISSDIVGNNINNTNNQFSNASSLVTSLSSSREGSPPDQNKSNNLFGMPPLVSKFFAAPTDASSSWIPQNDAQLRPSISIPHMPIFVDWSDI